MRILLDTHAFLWWIADSQRLSATAHSLISAPENAVHVSAASAWEISTKYRIGKFPEAAQVALDVAGVIASQGFEELPITVAGRGTLGTTARTPPGPFRPNVGCSGHRAKLGAHLQGRRARPVCRATSLVRRIGPTQSCSRPSAELPTRAIKLTGGVGRERWADRNVTAVRRSVLEGVVDPGMLPLDDMDGIRRIFVCYLYVSEVGVQTKLTLRQAESRPSTLTPKVSQLVGALEGAGVDEATYRAYLERKYL